MSAAAAFRDAFAFHLRRRRAAVGLEGARRGGRRALAGGVVLLVLVVLGVLPLPGGPILTAGLFLAFLVAGITAGAAAALRREGSAERLARALDGALGGEDLVPAAAALAARSGTPARFGAALLERAAEEVAALPADSVGPLPRPPWKLLGAALLVAILAALLPSGGLGLLPGLGTGWGTGGRPRVGGAVFGEPGEKRGGSPGPEAGGEAEGKRASEGTKGRPKDAPPEGGRPPVAEPGPVASLELIPLARRYAPSEPIHVGVREEGGAGAGKGTDLELSVSVDGGAPAAEGVRRRLSEGGRETFPLDLRGLPGLRSSLGPGTHRVAGELRDGAGVVVARSPEVEIVVEPGEGAGGDGKTPPEPKESRRPPPKPRPAPPAPEPGRAPPPPAAPRSPPERLPRPPVDLPPSGFEEKVVRPLFGAGAEVEKKGKILVLDPEGGRGEPPREVAPAEALAEVRGRAEDAARREGIDPRDAEAVRRYFEALRRLLEAGR